MSDTLILQVASIVDFWRKRDAPSIGQYFEDHPEKLPEPDSGRPVHSLLLTFFAIWLRSIVNSCDDCKGGREGVFSLCTGAASLSPR